MMRTFGIIGGFRTFCNAYAGLHWALLFFYTGRACDFVDGNGATAGWTGGILL